MIDSLLDSDLYKFSMMQAAFNQFRNVNVEYEFKCRNEAKWTSEMLYDINIAIDKYCELTFTPDEIEYLSTLRFFKKDFLDFLKLYKPNRSHIIADLKDDNLWIKVIGPWYLTISFEVPVLAITNEVYFKHSGKGVWTADNWTNGYEKLVHKMAIAKKSGFLFADFGTRRRIAKHWQETVIENLCTLPNFVGTSNVYFAKKFGIKPIGTMAHEFIMVGQGREDTPLKNSQKAQLQSWADEYRGDLGIALSDTLGVDAFLRDFDLYFAKLYDGLRHDSGDPIWWAEKVIAHYEKLGIDPMTKQLIFSDGLTMDKCVMIYNKLKDKAKISFGIGTHLTNDFDKVTPLQIVMKVTKVNGRPVAKISDSPGKGMCNDEHFLTYLKDVFKIEN